MANMGLITDLKPLNLDEEKNKFFQDFSYNPQFKYVRKFSYDELTKYGLPKEKFFLHAQKMTIQNGVYKKTDWETVSVDEVLRESQILFTKLGIKPLPINFTKNQVGRALLKESSLDFRLPIPLNKEQLRSVLNHEIQTHYLRKINNQIQGLSSINEEAKNIAFRKTEEGLANLHSFIDRKDKTVKKSYMGYIAAYLGQKTSFTEVFQALKKIGLSDDFAWKVTANQKRGIENTSHPGGFSKSLVYLEGTVAVWQWMQNPNNDPRDLYLGRISLDDVKTTKLKTDSTKSIYPTFHEDMTRYMEKINEIGKVNQFTELIDLQ